MKENFQIPWHWWDSPPRPYEVTGRIRVFLIAPEETGTWSYVIGPNQMLLLKTFVINARGQTAILADCMKIGLYQNQHLLWNAGEGLGLSNILNLLYLEPRLVVIGATQVDCVITNLSATLTHSILLTDMSWIVNDLQRHLERAPWL